MNVDEIVGQLHALASSRDRVGMARFGINTTRALGIGTTSLRRIGRTIGKDHDLALRLWDTRIHEARILASIVDDPSAVTEEQMEAWAGEFNSWDLVDQCCSNLFDKTPFAWDKAVEWGNRDEEFVKRAGYSLMACLAVHDKAASDSKFKRLFPVIRRGATDERNFVKKSVNWALRQIGKKNRRLNALAVAEAEIIRAMDSKAARWIASNARRELTSEKVQSRLR
jgi:3-methyladenine DNA glycosylase AlkD